MTTTPSPALPSNVEPWVIRKSGAFYRANRSGYTVHIEAAGIYTREEAEREARIEASISAHPLSEYVGEITEQRDRAQALIDKLTGTLARASTPTENEVVDEDLREIAHNAYDTIAAFGWSVTWRHDKPIPDDAWPKDIILRAVQRAVRARSASVTDAPKVTGWLKEDMERASARVEQWRRETTPPAHGEGELREDNWLFDTGPANAAKGPRILDACYTAFNSAKSPNKEDGGASDWFNDTYPNIVKLIEGMKRHAPSPPQQDRSGLVEEISVPKWLADDLLKFMEGMAQTPPREMLIPIGSINAFRALAPTPKASDHAPARAESVAPTQTEEEA